MSFRNEKEAPGSETETTPQIVKCNKCGDPVGVVNERRLSRRRCRCQSAALQWVREIMGLAADELVPPPADPKWRRVGRAVISIPGAASMPGHEVGRLLDLQAEEERLAADRVRAAGEGESGSRSEIPPPPQEAPEGEVPGRLGTILDRDMGRIVNPGPGVHLAGMEIRVGGERVASMDGEGPGSPQAGPGAEGEGEASQSRSEAPGEGDGEPDDPPEPGGAT